MLLIIGDATSDRGVRATRRFTTSTPYFSLTSETASARREAPSRMILATPLLRAPGSLEAAGSAFSPRVTARMFRCL
jgi:hypothetical protein